MIHIIYIHIYMIYNMDRWMDEFYTVCIYIHVYSYLEMLENCVLWILESHRPVKIEPAQTLRLFFSLRMSENHWNVDVICIEIASGSRMFVSEKECNKMFVLKQSVTYRPTDFIGAQPAYLFGFSFESQMRWALLTRGSRVWTPIYGC